MSSPKWHEITVSFPAACPPALVEDLFEAFESGGAPGAAAYESPSRVVTYIPDGPASRERLSDLRSAVANVQSNYHLPAEGFSSVEIEETDWAEAWKQYFKPRRIGDRFVICPTWEMDHLSSTENDILIVLDPGQAFGTGDHPTTRMMLELMESYVVPGQTVLDAGAGSGILTIAAAKLGAAKVWGSEIEHRSSQISRENITLNDCEASVVVGDGVRWFRGQVDVVLSNIISAILIRITPDVARVLAPSGLWILSGISEPNLDDVRRAVTLAGFTIIEIKEEGEWRSLVAKR